MTVRTNRNHHWLGWKSYILSRVASTREEARAKKEGVMPDFNAQSSTSEREEVFLIKWRGRSYLHSSWELRRDMEKFDPTGTT